MTRKFPHTSLLALLVALALPFNIAAVERHLLAFGNAAYPTRPLSNPDEDVQGICDALGGLGFPASNRHCFANLTAAEMSQQVQQLARQLNNGDTVLFYYSGHGFRDQDHEGNSNNYMLGIYPRGDRPTTRIALQQYSLSLNFVRNQLAAKNAKGTNILVVDACRESFDDIAAWLDVEPKNLSQFGSYGALDVDQGFVVAYSTATNQQSYGHKDLDYSVYTGELINVLKDPANRSLNILTLLNDAAGRTKVASANLLKKARRRAPPQSPWFSQSHVDFCFAPPCFDPRAMQALLDAQKEQMRQQQVLIAQLQAGHSVVDGRQSGGFEAPEIEQDQAAPQDHLVNPKNGLREFRDTLRDGGFGPWMVALPGGTFTLGDIQGGGDSDERPLQEHTLSPFDIGKYEITNAEFARFLNAKGRSPNKDQPWFETKVEDSDSHILREGDRFVVEKGYEDHPVIEVSWWGATAYAEWLSDQTGNTYRLPSEAQWEYAACAGTNTKYWWGNEDPICKKGVENGAKLDDDAECNDAGTEPVGSYGESGWGLFDTAGNVWEWPVLRMGSTTARGSWNV